MTLPSFLRFTGSLVPWSKTQLRKLDRLWMHAYKLALWISASTASCLLKFPDTMGGRGLPPPAGRILDLKGLSSYGLVRT